MINLLFRKVATIASTIVGTPWSFLIAFLVIVLWLASGPYFNYSDTWQLVINTTTTIITFLMVFLIQNTQNRDAKASHLKLDELIRAVEGTRKGLVDLEGLTDEELDQLQNEFQLFREQYTSKNERLLERVDEGTNPQVGKYISYSFLPPLDNVKLENMTSIGEIQTGSEDDEQDEEQIE